MKYFAVTGVVLGLTIIAGGLAVIKRAVSPASERSPAMHSYLADIEALKKDLQRTATIREQLSQFTLLSANPVNVDALIAQPIVPVAVEPTTTGSEVYEVKPQFPDRHLSVVYRTSGYRRAVIDGQIVGAGSRLPNGGKVVQIGADKVVMREQEGTRTLQMPIDQMRIGSVSVPVAPTQ